MRFLNSWDLQSPEDCKEIPMVEMGFGEVSETTSYNTFLFLEIGEQKAVCQKTKNQSLFATLCECAKIKNGNFRLLFLDPLKKNPMFKTLDF